MTRILAIDPGATQSAWLVLRSTDGRPDEFGILPNDELVRELWHRLGGYADVVIESVESYGMAVGREVFQTVWWAGRFHEACLRDYARVVQMPRRTVKLELCGSAAAKDQNVRLALLDRYGGKDAAVGRKAAPGPLYGVSRDVWSALAIAETYRSQLERSAA